MITSIHKPHIYLLFLLGILHLFGFAQDQNYAFQENKGQWNEQVKFRANTNGGYLYLEKDAFHYQFISFPNKHLHDQNIHENPEKMEGHVFRAEFIGANPNVAISSVGKSLEYYNYFLGNDQKKWANQVHNYQEITYKDLYQDIDLKIYKVEGFFKYDYIVKPEGHINSIKVKYKGVKTPSIKDGKLIIKHQLGKLIEEKPYAYQIIEGIKSEVLCNYQLNEKNELSFEFPNGYNAKHELIIDPTLIFSTYSGSASANFGMTATYDKLGNGYMGGTIFTTGYITTLGAFSRNYNSGQSDIVISKFSADGTQLMYSTYLGGTYSETVHSMVVDDSLHLIIFGVSSSPNYPTTSSAFDTSKQTSSGINLSILSENFVTGPDIVITKFNEQGTAILGSTFFGGDDVDGLNINKGNLSSSNTELLFNYGDQFRGEVIVDSSGNIFIGTVTYSNGLGQGNDTLVGVQDGILAKFSPNLDNLLWSKYLGGSGYDAIYSIKVLDNGNILVGGGTKSALDFPTTPNSYLTNGFSGSVDGFISIISSDGQNVLKSTLVGTPNYDQIYFIEFDRFGGIYALGQSTGGLMPLKNTNIADTSAGQFVLKFDSNLDTLIYATTFGDGGSGGQINISPTAFLVDQCQNVYASGWGGTLAGGTKVLTNNMPLTSNAFRSSTNTLDFYLYVMDRNLDTVLYGSFFGGTATRDHVDGGTSRFDKRGVIYQSVCASCGNGPTGSDFPTTPNSYAPTKNISIGGNYCNNALFKFDFEILPKAKIISDKTVICAPGFVTFKDSSKNAEELIWDFYGTTTRTQGLDTTIYFTVPGQYIVKQIARDTICDSYDSTFITIDVQANPILYQRIPDIVTCDTNQINIIARSNLTVNQFLWSSNAQFSDTLKALSDSTLLVRPSFTAKNYYIKLSNPGSLCEVIDTIRVQYIPLHANSSILSDTICEGSVVDFSSSFSNAQKFIWDFGNGIVDSVHLNPQIRYNTSGDFTIQVIVSNSSCVDPDTNTLQLNVQANNLIIQPIADTTYCGTDTLLFSINSQGTANHFLWSSNANFSDTLNNYPFDSIIQVFSNTNQIYYKKISDQYCETDSSVSIRYETYDVELASIPDSMCSPFSLQLNSSQIGVNSFLFDFGNGMQNSTVIDPTTNYLDSGTFFISLITNNLLCNISDTIIDSIRIEKQVVVIPLNDTSICLGDTILLNGNSLGSGKQFFWSNFSNFSNPLNNVIDSSIKIVPLDEFNNYYFKAENSICADSSSLQVITQDLDVEVDDYNSICIGDTITISSFNNSPFLINYLWGVNPAIIGSRSNNQIQVSPDSSSYFYLNTNTSIGCLDYDSAYVEVNLPAFDDALILSEFDTIYDGQYTQLSTNRNGNNLSYFWEPSTGLSNPNAANPIINPNQTTIYKVTITDNNTGCVVYAFRRIFVFEINCGEPEIFIPTAFTPNKDGQNDLFKIRGEFLESLNLQIFNRWGEKVFESNSIDDGWDGTYKGELVNPDVFVYHLTTKCFDGQEFFKKGNVTVIR